jgi:hypothetical protein
MPDALSRLKDRAWTFAPDCQRDEQNQRRGKEQENQRDKELDQTPHLICGIPPLDNP